LFSQEKKQKTFESPHRLHDPGPHLCAWGRIAHPAQKIKVFWFFSKGKNVLTRSRLGSPATSRDRQRFRPRYTVERTLENLGEIVALGIEIVKAVKEPEFLPKIVFRRLILNIQVQRLGFPVIDNGPM
jgi:hypothetical protein